MKKFEEKYFTNSVYVGIRNEYHKNQKFSKPFFTSFYDGFVYTPWGLKSITTCQILEVKENSDDEKGSHATEVEPIIFYKNKDDIENIMTKEEIQRFVYEVYAPIRREIFQSEKSSVSSLR